MRRPLLVLIPLCLLTGCAQSPRLKMTPAQQDTLQVRDVDAPPDRAFAAATSALVNAGYTIQTTDGEGGLITGVRREDPSIAKQAAVITLSTLISLGHAPMTAPPRYYAVCVQVLPRPGPADRAAVRICLYGHDNLKEEEALVDDLWIQMHRDLLAASHTR